MTIVKIFAGAVLIFGMAATHAAPIVSLGNLGDLHSTIAGAVEYTFDNFECPYASCAGDFAILSGTISGHAALPFGAEPNYVSVPFNNLPGSATFGLGFNANYFGLYWGSIDAYNSVSFFNDADLVATYSGADLVGAL